MSQQTDTNEIMYDVAILGAGPAGLTAAIYTCRGGLKTAVFESLSAGGQMALTEHLENYPGYSDSTSGYDLAVTMEDQAKGFGAQFIYEEVEGVDLDGTIKTVTTASGSYKTRTVIIATGARPAKLGAPGEQELTGRGVSYCATCDGNFFRGKDVAVIGGGNTAVADAIYLANIVHKVYLIHRRDSLRATRIYNERLEALDNVEILWNTEVERIDAGDNGAVDALEVRNNVTNVKTTLDVAGVFVAVGNIPNTEFLKGRMPLSEGGYVMAERDCYTDVPGVFAAGDVRTKTLRQVVTATADGAISAEAAIDYVNSMELEPNDTIHNAA